jgi:ribosomal protein S18 acetylase RimI-like enzyme
MQIDVIDTNWLKKLEPFFSASYGEEIEIQDELDFFEETQPDYWYVAFEKKDEPLGFIRHFPFMNGIKSEIEFYAKKDLAVEKKLLAFFDEKITNKEDIEIRVCLNKNNLELKNYLDTLGFNLKQDRYMKYEYNLKDTPELFEGARYAISNPQEIEAIQEILLEFEKTATEKVEQLIKEKRLVVYEKESKIVGVCLNNFHTSFLEIVEFTIKEEYRGKGYGQQLLKSVLALHRKLDPEINFTLQVKRENTIARNLYEKVGFNSNKEEEEIWLSKKYYNQHKL